MTEVRNQILARLDSPELRLYVVWVPVMSRDSAETAAESATRLADPRVLGFWDSEGALGAAMGRALELPRSSAGQGPYGFGWDLYLLYGGDARWSDPPPRPAFWMHQLMGIAPLKAPYFDGAELRRRVAAMLPAGTPAQAR